MDKLNAVLDKRNEIQELLAKAAAKSITPCSEWTEHDIKYIINDVQKEVLTAIIEDLKDQYTKAISNNDFAACFYIDRTILELESARDKING